MNTAGVSVKDRKVVPAALKRAEETGYTAVAMELDDGTIITGKTGELLGACAALLIKALKHLAGIGEDVLLITPNVIRPIQRLKVDYLGSKNPRLHMEEVLIALSASTETNPLADLALKQLPRLRGSQVHSSSSSIISTGIPRTSVPTRLGRTSKIAFVINPFFSKS